MAEEKQVEKLERFELAEKLRTAAKNERAGLAKKLREIAEVNDDALLPDERGTLRVAADHLSRLSRDDGEVTVSLSREEAERLDTLYEAGLSEDTVETPAPFALKSGRSKLRAALSQLDQPEQSEEDR